VLSASFTRMERYRTASLTRCSGTFGWWGVVSCCWPRGAEAPCQAPLGGHRSGPASLKPPAVFAAPPAARRRSIPSLSIESQYFHLSYCQLETSILEVNLPENGHYLWFKLLTCVLYINTQCVTCLLSLPLVHLVSQSRKVKIFPLNLHLHDEKKKMPRYILGDERILFHGYFLFLCVTDKMAYNRKIKIQCDALK